MGLDKDSVGTSLVVQWLRLHTPSVGDTGAIPRGVGGELRSHMAKKKKKKKFVENLYPQGIFMLFP